VKYREVLAGIADGSGKGISWRYMPGNEA